MDLCATNKLMFSGPFYSFRVYWDMVHSPFQNFREMPKRYVARIFVEALAFFILYFVGHAFFSTEYMIQDQFYEKSLFYRYTFLMLYNDATMLSILPISSFI